MQIIFASLKGLYIRSVYFLGIKAGGSVTHTSGVINAMRENIDLDVWTNDQLPNVNSKAEIVPAILPSLPFIGELLYNQRLLKKLRTNKNDYDFIYQRYSGESFAGARYAEHRKIPFILEFNSSEVWKLKNWSKTKNPLKNFIKKYIQLPIVARIEKYNLRCAVLIVVVSDALKETLVREGVPERKILVNPNGVDLKRFEGIQRDLDLLHHFGLESSFVFGFIGTFGKWHGVIELVKAAHKLYESHPYLETKVKFLLIGNGKLFNDVKDYVKRHNLEQHVVLTGRVNQEENTRYLGLCDAFISPHIPNPDGSKFFGSPTKLFEYMACNRPIIASNLDQIGQVLEHNRTALLTIPGDTDDLAHSIYCLYCDTTLQTKLANNAYNQARSKHGWDHHVNTILSKINDLSRGQYK